MSVPSEIQTTLHEMLSIDIRNARGSRQLLDKIVSLMDFSGFRIVEQMASFSDVDHINLVGTRGPNKVGGLLLTAAIDTAGCTEGFRWTHTEEDPFNPTEKDGFLYAHGANGGKVDLVCKLMAVANVPAESLQIPVTVAALIGDQARVAGAMQLLDSGICQPQFALVGEPTNLELVTAHRGYFAFQFDFAPNESLSDLPQGNTYSVVCRGERAHSTSPYLGRNAVELMTRHLARFCREQKDFTVHQLEGGHRTDEVPDECRAYIHVPACSDWMPTGNFLETTPVKTPNTLGPNIRDQWTHLKEVLPRLHELFRWSTSEDDSEFYPPTPIYNVSGVRTQIDGTMQILMDYRPLPGQRCETLVTDIELILRQTKTNPTQPSPVVQVLQNRLAMDASDDGNLVTKAKQVLRQLHIPAVTSTHAESTEGWILNAAGIETIVFGPGSAMGVKRRANEHTSMSQINAAVRFYEELIRKVCSAS